MWRVTLRQPHLLLTAALVWLAPVDAVQGTDISGYHAINGALCIDSAFTEPEWLPTSRVECAAKCDPKPRCQAFNHDASTGACRHYVFNKCSRGVRNCSCTASGRVYIKQQPGLPGGLLCPAQYANDLCGVKYRAYANPGVWLDGRQKCESELGLTVMADISDAAERDRALSLAAATGYDNLYVSGVQTAGSLEPASGWRWASCNGTVNSSLWALGQPNDILGTKSVAAVYTTSMINPGLADLSSVNPTVTGVLCECLSPF